jgi:hypothetical protein
MQRGFSEEDFEHMHPKIKAAMAPVLKKFGGRVMIQEVMENAGVWWGDLPVMEKYRNPTSGHNELCLNHVCGRCRWGDSCEFIKNHAKKEELSDDFVDRLVKVLKPGLEVMSRSDYVRKYSNKRGRPEAGGRIKHERRH